MEKKLQKLLQRKMSYMIVKVVVSRYIKIKFNKKTKSKLELFKFK